MIILNDIRKDAEIQMLIEKANQHLGVIGYTEHGERHVSIVSERAKKILTDLHKPEPIPELGAIAGYIHDIGNVISRNHHAPFGALLAYPILKRLGMDLDDITEIISAIANHHEDEGDMVSDITAAIVLADKSDVHFSRVRNPLGINADIHDRVNYASRDSKLTIDSTNKIITLDIMIDQKISPVMEYFEIFLTRMIMSRKAAGFLGLRFELVINGVHLA